MEGMNVNGKPKRAPKQKVYTVDTRKPRANAELSVLTPANGFEEIVSSKPLRKAPVHRYFRFGRDERDRINGYPGGKDALELLFRAAAGAPPPPPAPMAPQLPPAPANSQGSYGAMHEDDSIDDLANTLAEQGVASQGEFDELAALMEQKAQIGGARRRSRRQKTRGRKSRHRSRRYRK
jgi:hypothetical protein